MLRVYPLLGMPEIEEGFHLASHIEAAMRDAQLSFEDGDILVVSSKVVSKALGLRTLDTDPATHEGLVASQTLRIVAERVSGEHVTRIVESAAGPVMTAAGVDASNTGKGGLLALPVEPDQRAADLRASLGLDRRRVAIVISDTSGRPWRVGQVDFALGASGLAALDDLRGGVDADGRRLTVTARAIADEVAAAADLVKGKSSGIPAALVRGIGEFVHLDAGGARGLIRSGQEDWFSHGTQEAVRASLGVEPGSAIAEDVGLASVSPESLSERLGRAVRLATAKCESVTAQLTPDAVRLTSEHPFLLGRAAARLEGALWCEDLSGRNVEIDQTSHVLIHVTERDQRAAQV